MIRALRQLTWGLGLALCLAACGSSPQSHFYRLTPAPPTSSGGQQPSLGVGPIDIPEFLDRNTLVYSDGDNRLQIAGNQLWAEPLGDGVQRVVGLNLASLLNTENVNYFPWDPRHRPRYGIRISVLDLDANDAQAILVADWLLYHPGDGATVTRRISSFTEPLAGGTLVPEALPRAYSALLYQLSETIAAAIRADWQTAAAASDHQSSE